MAGFFWSTCVWIMVQIGLTMLAKHHFGDLDKPMKFVVLTLSTLVATFVDFMF